jgi:hypothetical protein
MGRTSAQFEFIGLLGLLRFIELDELLLSIELLGSVELVGFIEFDDISR